MSCFESSTFLKNPNVMNQALLIEACERLKWSYKINQGTLLVYNTNQAAEMRGEYILRVSNNTVSYNDYYIKNGKSLVETLKKEFYALNVVYAKTTVIASFKQVGFSLLPDYDFVKNEQIVERFSMVGYSKIKEETEKKTVIQFSILYDGTVISDSNYIPSDLHDLADQAMEQIDTAFGTQREEGVHIKRKEIPLKYKHKAYCIANHKIKAKH